MAIYLFTNVNKRKKKLMPKTNKGLYMKGKMFKGLKG